MYLFGQLLTKRAHAPVTSGSYADRDAKRRWANQAMSSSNLFGFGLGGIGGQLVGGVLRSGLSRVI